MKPKVKKQRIELDKRVEATNEAGSQPDNLTIVLNQIEIIKSLKILLEDLI